MTKRTLVTGGAGYIGSHTAKRLAHHNFAPIVLDNLSTGHRWAVRSGPLIVGDLADEALLHRVFNEHAIDTVLHFAASAYVGESMRDPQKYFRNNVVNTLNLLNAMVQAGVKNIVFSSSCATYGIPQNGLIEESHPQYPVNPYGESKLFVERTLHWYGKSYGLKWVALRYFNAAGADPEGELGEDHTPETHLIPLAIEAALRQRRYIEVFGTDYPTADGTAIRDYIHVMDLAEAHVLALEYLLAGGESGAFNLGTGCGHSVLEIIAAVERLAGCPVPVRKTGRREGDPPALVAGARRAKQLLKWQPFYAEIDCIIETAWKWHTNRSRLSQAAAGR
jgi:UDP-glucose-4-epimerase GalE